MQTWSLSTQCVSCYLRAYLRQELRSTRLKYAHGVPVPRRYATIERHRQRNDFPRQAKPFSKPDEKRLENRPPRPLQKRLDGSTENFTEHDIIRFRDRILAGLDHNDRLLRSDISKLEPELHYLKLVDPEGSTWSTYYEAVKSSVRIRASQHKKGMYNKVGNSMVSRLYAAAQYDFHAPVIDREVRFGFLDHVLSKGVTTTTGEPYKADLRYPTEWYPKARTIQRHIHLHVGPTNSGKTYNALKRLEQAQNGFYAGPLRLLAHEVYSRFNDRGIACDLVTGDDVRLHEGGDVKLYASTVEMVNIEKEQEVGVIDEIQMMNSEDRGWAWTRALLGAPVKELHLCGETRVVPLIRELVASMGDTLHIHQYERLNPLKVMSRSLGGDLKNLRKGDCVVSFSVVGIHALKRQIELETGKRVAIVYGSLPPETRARQAALFNDPDNDYDFLVASDAIGMGLNLSIKRVVFETTSKWNGTFRERLSISQIKQIAGRAGRYRTSQDDKASATVKNAKPAKSIGLVTCLDEADIPILQHALRTDAPPLKTSGLLPAGDEYETVASLLPPGTPFEYISRRVFDACSIASRFRLCENDDNLLIARVLDSVPNLQLRDRLIFCASPAMVHGRQKGRQDHILLSMARVVAESRPVTVVDLPEIPLEALDLDASPDREYLESLEILHKSLILYLWLSYRFPQFFRDQDMAMHAKSLTEEKINDALISYSANPKLRARLLEMKKTSTLLQDRLRASGGAEYLSEPAEEEGVTLNPDATVEEVERRAREEAAREANEAQETTTGGDGTSPENNGVHLEDVTEAEQQPASSSSVTDNEVEDAGREYAGGSVEETVEPAELKAMEETEAETEDEPRRAAGAS